MREQSLIGLNLAVAGACALIGVLGLPLIFGSAAQASVITLTWLALAVIAAVVTVLAAVPLSAALAQALLRFSITRSQASLLARLLTGGVALILIQAILRRPLAILFGSPLEAAIAAIALTFVLALSVWAYQTARVAVQSLTLQAIDAAIPTVSPAPVAEPTRTAITADEATVRAPRDDEATIRAPRDDDPTIRSPHGPADA